MRRFAPLFIAVSLVAIAPAAAHAGPGKNIPGATTGPKGPKLPTKRGSVDAFQGVMSSINVKANGEILEIYVKVAGSNRTERIKGCGARSADHPLLNWAFMERRLASFTTSSGCLENVTVSR